MVVQSDPGRVFRRLDGTGERDRGWEEQRLPSKRGAPLDMVELTERLVSAPSANDPSEGGR